MRLLFAAAVVVVIAWVYMRVVESYDECTVLQTIPIGDARVEIVDNKCKEGLPHTTGPQTIRMTRGTWDGPRRAEILTHERVHLAQKQRGGAEAWRDFYEREWGYKCYADPPSGIPADLVARLRPNPDTSDSPWAVWRGRWLFFPAFTTAGSLRDAEVIVWDLENHRQTAIPAEWRDAFCGQDSGSEGGCPHQYEHPHEISAEWLAVVGHGQTVTAPAAVKLFAWKK